MSTDQQYQVTVECECNHRRGLLYYAIPWRWGQPCRHCRRYPSKQVITVNQPAGAPPPIGQPQHLAAVSPGPSVIAPIVTGIPVAQFATDPPPQYESFVNSNCELPVKSS